MSLSRDFAGFVAGLKYEDLPAAVVDRVQAMARFGIPVMGHLGMMPQSVHQYGGYKVQGKERAQADTLLSDAKALEAAGAFAIVLELVTPPVAKEISHALPIPTIGIGSGGDCDGQILVTNDLLGTFPWFTPKFVKSKLDTAGQMKAAVAEWMKGI